MKIKLSPSEPGMYAMWLLYEDFRRTAKKVGLLERYEAGKWRVLWNLERIEPCGACGCTNRWAWSGQRPGFPTKREAQLWAQEHMAEIEPSRPISPTTNTLCAKETPK